MFFRDSTRREAAGEGVAGWVRNNPDGTAEAVFEGEDDAVERLVAFVRAGPGHAAVEHVEVRSEEPEGIHGFVLRPGG